MNATKPSPLESSITFGTNSGSAFFLLLTGVSPLDLEAHRDRKQKNHLEHQAASFRDFCFGTVVPRIELRKLKAPWRLLARLPEPM